MMISCTCSLTSYIVPLFAMKLEVDINKISAIHSNRGWLEVLFNFDRCYLRLINFRHSNSKVNRRHTQKPYFQSARGADEYNTFSTQCTSKWLRTVVANRSPLGRK